MWICLSMTHLLSDFFKLFVIIFKWVRSKFGWIYCLNEFVHWWRHFMSILIPKPGDGRNQNGSPHTRTMWYFQLVSLMPESKKNVILDNHHLNIGSRLSVYLFAFEFKFLKYHVLYHREVLPWLMEVIFCNIRA